MLGFHALPEILTQKYTPLSVGKRRESVRLMRIEKCIMKDQ